MRSQRAATFSVSVNGKFRTLGQTRRDEANLCLPRRSLGEGGTSDISLLPPTDMPVLSEAPLGLPVSHWL